MSTHRIGHGYDIHRLQPGGELTLGGVVVASDISPIAHSDGDVVIHAIVDALMGAAGLGDIGDAFPNSDEQFRNVSSIVFLTNIMSALGGRYRVINCDVTILAEQPKLKPFKQEMTALL